MRQWTFSRRIGASLAITVLFAVAIGGISLLTLRNIAESNRRVTGVNVPLLLEAGDLHRLLEQKIAAGRGFLLSPDQKFAAEIDENRRAFAEVAARMKQELPTLEDRRIIQVIESKEAEHQQALDRAMTLRRSAGSPEAVSRVFETEVVPLAGQIIAEVESFIARQQEEAEKAKQAAADATSSGIWLMAAVVLAVLLFAMTAAILLSRILGRQIGTAVAHVQSSSAELQAAANQQATGAKEQATAMSEISTTISELLATARQIAESGQRVAQIADQTVATAGGGENKVDQAHESIAAIRQQVDMIVSHMLDLGRKSQQIGSILDIVSELAEQTNILAINATIEAAGAGDAGLRFSVVADEIRQLADRVSGSTKEIRPLIDDMRAAVNTTIMTTETGSKAVDAGSQQFGEVASSFREIARLLTTTNEAAREIELSTKQQTSAVEQVNAAIANVAQTTRETEVSSQQTLETVSQLASLSRDLRQLVQPQTAG